MTLWREVGEVIDAHILGTRPAWHMQRRYTELMGMNWLSLRDQPYAGRWPSDQVKHALGVPLHDLRTLLADMLRLHDPETAPQLVSTMLGHRSREAGEAYRALCSDTAAQRQWQELRARHMSD